jgi:outer membrane protein OmpA-like peptidoglycan-associated protein/ABC-type nitrate/sulfonate/bicarbonate transport system substrate-binding protein
MRRVSYLISSVVSLCLFLSAAVSAEIQYLTAKPMSQFVAAQVGPVNTSSGIKVPVITWGADVKTILADKDGIFKEEGLNVSLYLENDLTKQVQACISGKTPYIRGTMGMVCDAVDAFSAKGLEMVVIYQLSWSTGGDAMVARAGKNLKNINTVALQIGGPHMDYAANVFKSAGRLNNIQFKWLKELTLPTQSTSGKIIDPVSAFPADNGLDAVFCITVDANTLTSGGKVGTGAEGSVKGSTIILTTKTASRIIADVYAVRKDYFDANREEVLKFVHAMMRADEALQSLRAGKSGKYKQLLSTSADMLLGSSTASSDVDGMIGDCELSGYNSNVAFFTGKGTTRNFENLTSEIQSAFIGMKLMSGRVKLHSANWDYSKLASGLQNATVSAPAIEQTFDTKKVAAKVENQINKAAVSGELSSWEEGTLFTIEINFQPNQNDFVASQYANDFQEALNRAQTYGGSLITIEGHADPMGILKAQQEGKSKAEIDQMVQVNKNLSLQRANSVRSSFIKFCKAKGFNINESQFTAVGLGNKAPKYAKPRTKEEWLANMRVVFRIKQVEAELSDFQPLQ